MRLLANTFAVALLLATHSLHAESRKGAEALMRTSLKFAEIDLHNADLGPNAWRDSLKKARVEWESARFRDGEADDDFFRLCFPHFDPLDGDFMALARLIGHPLLAHEARP